MISPAIILNGWATDLWELKTPVVGSMSDVADLELSQKDSEMPLYVVKVFQASPGREV
jgi:hypothetical protein